ncbi:hypothetical protein B0H11DRAFT_2324863 [Mycena galericulata]|nr:hypothetical protein B0H11DRAFT_2324863 [Mycena galericulata]
MVESSKWLQLLLSGLWILDLRRHRPGAKGELTLNASAEDCLRSCRHEGIPEMPTTLQPTWSYQGHRRRHWGFDGLHQRHIRRTEYTITASPLHAATFSWASSTPFYGPSGLTVINGPDPNYPAFGAVDGSASYRLAPGSYGYTYFSGVGETCLAPAGAHDTPSNSAGNSIAAIGYSGPA